MDDHAAQRSRRASPLPRHFQWVNLYEERGWSRLVRALEVGLKRRAEMTGAVVQAPPLLIPTPTVQGPSVDTESTAQQHPPERSPSHERSEARRELERMRSSHLSAAERVAAGNALAQLGDPRFRADAWYLPDEPLLGFVEIPAEPFRMGSDKKRDPAAFDDELPQHEVTLPRYYIARYPVTVAQFRAFVEESRDQPDAEASLRGAPNHPVVEVTWYAARQYCDWLTERLRTWEGTPQPLAGFLRQEGWQVTLPSEAEWEKAARGMDGRIYPWGNEPEPNRANYHETGINITSAVGCFPGGASPYGIEDLSGNVWEWTRSRWGEYPYPTDETERAVREDVEAKQDTLLRVRRGGAFYYPLRNVRCASRNGYPLHYRFRNIGFRVVVRPSV